MFYHPEMNEKPDQSKLFAVHHNFRNSYSCAWRKDRDAEAREVLKKLRIRPMGRHTGDAITEHEAGKTTYGPWKDVPLMSCLITDHAASKLDKADLTAHLLLLD